MENIILQKAFEYHNLGLSTIPLKIEKGLEKVPLKTYAEFLYNRPQTIEDLENLFNTPECGIGILGGINSNNLFIADFDSIKSYKLAKTSFKHFNDICNKTLIVKTRRGFHVYLRSINPVSSSKVIKYNIDIKGQGGFVVAPPTKRSDGKAYEFINNNSIYTIKTFDEVPFMNLKEYKDDIPKYVNGSPEAFPSGKFYGLNDKCYNIIKKDSLEGYKSSSEAIAYVTFTCVKNHWSENQVIQLFKQHASSISKANIRGNIYVKSIYKKACDKYLNNMREVDKQLVYFENNLKNIQWPRIASYYISTLQSIINISRNCGKINNLCITTRQLALKAGFEQQTAVNMLHRLLKMNILQIEYTNSNKSNVYKINMEEIKKKYINNDLEILSHSLTKEGECIGMTKFDSIQTNLDPSHDAFRYKALNKTGFLVLNYIHLHKDTSFTFKNISEAINISKKTLKSKLKILEKLYIIKLKDSLYFPMKSIGFIELNEIAKYFGTENTYFKQERKYDCERENRIIASKIHIVNKNNLNAIVSEALLNA